MLEAKRREFDAMVAGRNATSAEEMEILKAEFERDAEGLATAAAEEKRRQYTKLQERVKARRARKARDVSRQQEKERMAVEASQRHQREELRAKEERQAEQQALQAVLSAQTDIMDNVRLHIFTAQRVPCALTPFPSCL